MFLYHGTWEENFEKILEDGILNNQNTSDETESINKFFIELLGTNPRKDCLYLSLDEESVDAYDRAFRIKVSELDKTKLFVGNFKLIDSVYFTLMTLEIGECEKESIKLTLEKYIATMMTLEDYLKYKDILGKRYFPEILYFLPVKVEENDVF